MSVYIIFSIIQYKYDPQSQGTDTFHNMDRFLPFKCISQSYNATFLFPIAVGMVGYRKEI